MSVLKSNKARKSQKISKAKKKTESSIESETDTKTCAVVNDRISERNTKQNDIVSFPPQRRFSSGSYTLEKPTFPVKLQQMENDENPTLPVIKTPVPLPRRKKSKENKLQSVDDIVSNKVTEVKIKEEIAVFQYKSDASLEDRLHRYFN